MYTFTVVGHLAEENIYLVTPYILRPWDFSRPPGAVAIIYEFDQHNDAYFKYLLSIGSPESLIVKVYKWFFVSENMTIDFDAD